MFSSHTSQQGSRLIDKCLLGAIVASFGALFLLRPPQALSLGFAPHAPHAAMSDELLFESHVVSNGSLPYVHSATAADIGDGRIRAFWLGGSRESHPNVAIFTAVFDPHTRVWSPERIIMTVEWVRRHLARNVISLGNPAVMRHPDGRLLLWFVSVSIGGWSGSSINLSVSHDNGETWEAPTRLITSPFFNVSTLVRQPAFAFADGTIGLPVYHEFIGKFAELLRLDSNGRVLHKQRLSWGRSTLQPIIVTSNHHEATGFLRRAGSAPSRLLTLETDDGGKEWSQHRPLEIHNPGAPIAAVRLDSGEVLIAFNNAQDQRTHLTLALLDEETNAPQMIHIIDGDDRATAAGSVSYPALIRTSNGEFHVLYTADRLIRHVRLNMAWLEQKR